MYEVGRPKPVSLCNNLEGQGGEGGGSGRQDGEDTCTPVSDSH